MSMVPYLLEDYLDELRYSRALRPSPIVNRYIDLGILEEDMFNALSLTLPLLSGYIRPSPHRATRERGVSSFQDNQDGFMVNLDVQQFKPEEIIVKIVDDFVVVEGKHEERRDEHGYISRQFQRRYKLPEDVDPDAVVSKLSSDGVLSVEAPKKAIEEQSKERIIPITPTNAPAAISEPFDGQMEDGDEDGASGQMDE